MSVGVLTLILCHFQGLSPLGGVFTNFRSFTLSLHSSLINTHTIRVESFSLWTVFPLVSLLLRVSQKAASAARNKASRARARKEVERVHGMLLHWWWKSKTRGGALLDDLIHFTTMMSLGQERSIFKKQLYSVFLF